MSYARSEVHQDQLDDALVAVNIQYDDGIEFGTGPGVTSRIVSILAMAVGQSPDVSYHTVVPLSPPRTLGLDRAELI